MGCMQGGLGLVAGAAVHLTRQMQSLEAAQRLCDSMLVIPSPGGSFFQAAISMELAAIPTMPSSVPRVQRLFEVSYILLEHCLDVLHLRQEDLLTHICLSIPERKLQLDW